ncbi:HEAT repeat domain-containing protein [Paenibacillus polymyxa]|uniref:HEAT repeat domain-containing protein n=1 Tax=Paenibacillus polymyxa TaxID=1406 RepID=UPI000C9F8734|nr:HEAT repeat domain-containing protein [Paenibacillus polymyxa]MCJ1218604.1 HEAT repeat domain-containing protein [Paenibacillus polymyxa]PNQ86052.1 SMI1/KNR4 family protein [Paenibacillus polymyxa]
MSLQEVLERQAIDLPDDTLEALLIHSKKQEGRQVQLRLLSEQELSESIEWMTQIKVFKHIVPLWTDDHSNYVGLYVEGPLAYKLCYINHQETDLSPRYRSTASLIAELEQNPELDWEQMRKDYPSDNDISTEQLAEDIRCMHEMQAILEKDSSMEDDVRCQLLYSLMAITPVSEVDSLLPYVDDEDMYVQERACTLLGYHGYEPATELLKEVMKHGSPNGKLAARKALSMIRAKQMDNHIKK